MKHNFLGKRWISTMTPTSKNHYPIQRFKFALKTILKEEITATLQCGEAGKEHRGNTSNRILIIF